MTEDDLTWEGGETADGTEEDSHRERRAAQAAITEINRAKEEALVNLRTTCHAVTDAHLNKLVLMNTECKSSMSKLAYQ